MRSFLVIRAAAFAVALLVGTTGVRADEREDRDRKARAALALTAPMVPKVGAAPKPREVGAEYATAYARAVEQAKPLVCYVGCKADHKAPGAVPAKADALPGVKGPAAVVMYPRGDGLLVHRVMQCPVDDDELQRAIKDASKKSGASAGAKSDDKPAPRPLDWQIRADEPEDRPARSYRLPAKLPDAQMTTMSRAEMSKWRTKAPSGTVYTMLAGRVIDTRSGTEEVLSPWALYVSTFADVDVAVRNAQGTDLPPNVRPSLKIVLGDRAQPIYLNGERFDPRDCRWFPDGCEGEPHHEFLRWYAYTGACKVEKRPGGGWDFTSLEGAERDAAYRGGGAEPDAPWILANYFRHEIRSLKECRAMWSKETPAEDREFVARQPVRVQARRAAPGGAHSESHARTKLDVLRDSFVRVRTDRFGGSGVVAWSEPGRSLVFTCWHVVNDGSPIVVRTGGRTLPAKLIDVDREADVALLEVARELPAVVAVEADAPAVGDEVVMLGASSIWSRGKVLDTEDANGRPSASGSFEGYSGDSGGPVFCRGVLVGIVRGVGVQDGRAKFSTKVGAMLVRGIKREPVTIKGTPAVSLAQTGPKPAALPDCPNGNCTLKPATYAAPVMLPASGCAGGNCPAPNYAPARGGIFRRW